MLSLGVVLVAASPHPVAGTGIAGPSRVAETTPAPSPTDVPTPTETASPPHAGSAGGIAPKIFYVKATPPVAHAGDSIHWLAHVSRDVSTVTCRVALFSFSLYPVRAGGYFGETLVIPKNVPFFFRGKYSVTVTASNASGASTSRIVPLTFQ